MQTLDLPNPTFVPRAVAFSPDGRLLAVCSITAVGVLDLGAGATLAHWQFTPAPDDRRSSGRPAVGFTADSQGVVAFRAAERTGGNTGGLISVYDLAGNLLRERPASNFAAVEIGPGGRLVYASDYEKNKLGIIRWDPLTGETSPKFGESKRDIFNVAVSTDERCVLASIYNAVRVLKLTGKELPKRASRQLEADNPYLSSWALTVSSEGTYAAACGVNASSCHIEAWVVGSGERIKIANTTNGYPPGRNVHFHRSKPLLAYCFGTDEVVFWDAASRLEVKRFAWGIGRISTLAFSPDGLRCAVGGAGKVVVWDVDA